MALISQENGLETLVVELPGTIDNESAVSRRVKLDTFAEALTLAREKLMGVA